METQKKNNIQPAMCSSDVIECLENLVESPYNDDCYFIDTEYLFDATDTIRGRISESLEIRIRDIEENREICINNLKAMQNEAYQISVMLRLIKNRVINDHITNIGNLIYYYEKSKEQK